MTHRERYAEACRKAFEGYRIPDGLWEGRKNPIRKDRIPKNQNLRWTREDVLRLVGYCRQGLRSKDIAPLMGRSEKAIQKAFVRFDFPSLTNICPPTGCDNPAWKGGVHMSQGYLFRLVPNHPYANSAGYVQEHRLVIEEHLGRFLLPTEVVHHKDGNRLNNDISNLEVFSSNGGHLKATLSGVKHNVSEGGRLSLSASCIERWRNPEMRARMSKKGESSSVSHRELWKDPEYRKRQIAAQIEGKRRAKNQLQVL